MIHIVAQCHEEGLEHYLRSYVKVKITNHMSHFKVYMLVLVLKVLSACVSYSLYLSLSHKHPPPTD